MEHLVMMLIVLLSGFGVSAGTFAFILIIGIVPRMMQRFEINNVMLIENVIVLGVILGNLSSLWYGTLPVSLAEILHTFPILFTRLDLNRGLRTVVTAMALGKLVGALFYFYYGYCM